MQQRHVIRVFNLMGAMLCELKDCGTAEVGLYSAGLFARGVNILPERRCPNCRSIIYSRRHKLCGVCSEPLPTACQFSPVEAHNVESLVNEERQRHRKWLNRFNFGN